MSNLDGVTCHRCASNIDDRPAVVYLNDEPLCTAHASRELHAIADQGRGVIVDIGGPRVIDVRVAESCPTHTNRAQGGMFGFGECTRCADDAVVLLDDEPLCLEHYNAQLAATRRRLYPDAS